jgi:patatin-like phospholipase/acyl hydrolase
MSYLILSCDGGGMRGYLSSLLLQRLEEDLGLFGQNNGNIDLYAGTSTGGLIALGLAYGKNIDSVVSLYQSSGSQIFHPLGAQAHCLLSAAAKPSSNDLADLKGLWQTLFDNIGKPSVRTVVEEFIPGNPVLNSLPNKVMVVTLQLRAEGTPPNWGPIVIDNLEGSDGADTFLYDAALSTSAAPVYFPPYAHPKLGWCSDGGLFANNPAPLAVGRAISTGQALQDIAVLSIGTGLTPASMEVTQSSRLCFGLNHWMELRQEGPTPPFPLLNAIMDNVSASNDFLCRQILDAAQPTGRYMRVNPALPKAVALDDYSPATMKMFEQTAADYFKTEVWAQIEDWVESTFQK